MVEETRNAVYRELLSVPPRYDAKPARFALNQGSRKLYSGDVICPGLIRSAGLEHYHFKLAYVILQMADREFFETTSKNGDIGRFNLQSHF